MNWVVVAIIVLAAIVFICFLIKIHLKKRLDSIDGFGGKFTKNQDEKTETVIGVFGEIHPKEKD